MYTITGVTGQVGSAVANELLAAGADVRVLARDETKAEPWSLRGAEVAVADLRDASALSDAVRGSRGAFVLLPLDLTSPTVGSDAAQLVASIGEAIEAAGVPHVVGLSALGAGLSEGTGAIGWLHRFENRLRATGSAITAVRSGHFQEKARDLLGAVHGAGIYPVLRDSADAPIPMVAVRDVGAVIASALREPTPAHRIIDVVGPEYTERQVAETIGRFVGRPVEVVTVPRPGWEGVLAEAGLSTDGAELIAELYDADQRGVLQPTEDRLIRGRTTLEETLRGLLGAQPAPAG